MESEELRQVMTPIEPPVHNEAPYLLIKTNVIPQGTLEREID